MDEFADEDALEQVLLDAGLLAVVFEGFLGGLGDDDLVGFTVDHDLPAAGADRLAAFGELRSRFRAVHGRTVFVALPYRKTPLFEKMNRVVDVTAQVIDKILADDAHEVSSYVFDVISRVVLAAIGIDSGQTHGNSAATVSGSLVDHRDSQTFRGSPLGRFVRSAAASHATADQQNIRIHINNFGLLAKLEFVFFNSHG